MILIFIKANKLIELLTLILIGSRVGITIAGGGGGGGLVVPVPLVGGGVVPVPPASSSITNLLLTG